MKKTAILLLFTALLACNKNTNQETKNTKVLWAENVQSNVTLVRDSLWSEYDWYSAYKYNKGEIFSSITQAVYSGKLTAYYDYLSYPLSVITVKEFNNILVQWDSTAVVEDPNEPGTMIFAPIKMEIVPDDIVQLRFNEKIELDTLSYILIKKVSSVSIFANKTNDYGEVVGIKHLFDVKFNDLSENP